MRKASPDGIFRDFMEALKEVGDSYLMVEESELPLKSKKHIAEYSLLAAMVLWEGFLSDLIVAYINQDGSRFRAYVSSRFQLSTKDPIAKEVLKAEVVQVGLPRHLTVDQIRSYLDPKGGNIAFSSISEMKKSVGMWLSPEHAKPFLCLDSGLESGLEAARAVRNYLGHRSARSKVAMQLALAAPAMFPRIARGKVKVHDVGAFLRAKPEYPFTPRIVLYVGLLGAVAQQIHPLA